MDSSAGESWCGLIVHRNHFGHHERCELLRTCVVLRKTELGLEIVPSTNGVRVKPTGFAWLWAKFIFVTFHLPFSPNTFTKNGHSIFSDRISWLKKAHRCVSYIDILHYWNCCVWHLPFHKNLKPHLNAKALTLAAPITETKSHGLRCFLVGRRLVRSLSSTNPRIVLALKSYLLSDLKICSVDNEGRFDVLARWIRTRRGHLSLKMRVVEGTCRSEISVYSNRRSFVVNTTEYWTIWPYNTPVRIAEGDSIRYLSIALTNPTEPHQSCRTEELATRATSVAANYTIITNAKSLQSLCLF